MKYLSVTLKLLATYMMVLGIFSIFFQPAGQILYLFSVIDSVTTRIWGGALFALAIFYLIASYDVEKYRDMIWVGVIHLSTMFLILIYHLATGVFEPAEAVVRLVLNPIFILLLMTGIVHKPREKVLWELRKEGNIENSGHMPEHVREKHPLHGK